MDKYISYFKDNKKECIVYLVLFILFVLFVLFFIYFLNVKEDMLNRIKLYNNLLNKENISSSTFKDSFKVDIKGEVNKPGIYEMDSDKRVNDVVIKAGGLTKNADTSVINLSKRLEDEMVIIIYSKDQVKNMEKIEEISEIKNNKCNEVINNIKNDACMKSEIKTSNTSSNKVSINSGLKEELMNLPDIGDKKADAIIKYRNTYGGFKTLEDIMKVEGIKESTYAKIKEYITL